MISIDSIFFFCFIMSISIVTLSSISKSNETGKWVTEDGTVISGVGVSMRKFNCDNKTWAVCICKENRVALTREEQGAIGSKQPYLLPNEPLLNAGGLEISILEVGREIYKRIEGETCSDEKALEVTQKAKELGLKFSNRHFLHHILRETIEKKDTSILDALNRLLSEEFTRKFKDSVQINENTKVYVYTRPGGKTGVATFIIDYNDTKTDVDALMNKGFCNWFSPKKVPAICDNSYYETKDHRFVTKEQCWRTLSEFHTVHSELGCDLSRWGALDYYHAMMAYIFV